MLVTIAEAQAAKACGLRCVVTLNGEDVSMSARWADPDAGLVCLIMRDEDGRAWADLRLDVVMTQTIAGVVRVEFVEEPAT